MANARHTHLFKIQIKHMKKSIIAILMATMSLTALAQNATISGKFKKLLPNGLPSESVFIAKPDNADLAVLAEPMIDKATKTFNAELNASDQDVIRYVGIYGELYPFYLHKGENLVIDAGDGAITYSGKVSKENKVFADWYKMLLPLRKYGYTPKGYTLPSDGYVKLLDSLAKPVADFVQNINTGNASFDKQVKYLLPYSYKFDVLMPIATGLNVGAKNEYPSYLVNWFKNETFSDKQIWTLPIGFKFMQNFGFAKHIIYNNEQGIGGQLLVPEIADKELKAEFALAQAEKGATFNLLGYLETYRSSMVTDKQKAKMKVLEARAKVKVAGGDWIDFSYPDLNGKMHHLSENLGKVVLIDVWATWCKPCLEELPALEALEKAFEGKNVTFISLSIDTDKAKWKQMVESKKMSGLHLFSNRMGPIAEDYEIETVPRYMLFDKNGKTVAIDAPRPSDPKLTELINSKL